MARAIARRNIFGRVDILEGLNRPAPDTGALIFVHGNALRIQLPGATAKSLRLDAHNYRARVGPITARAIRPDEGVSLALIAIEAEVTGVGR